MPEAAATEAGGGVVGAPERGDKLVATPAAHRAPGRPRSETADRAILEATWAEVAAHGLAGLSLDKVAARAGVSKATIYRRWASKEALVLDSWKAAKADGPRIADTGSIRGDLLALREEFVEHLTHGPLASLFPEMVAAARQNAELAEQFSQFHREQAEPVRAIIERAKARGDVRADVDTEILLTTLLGTFTYVLLIEHRVVTAPEGDAILDLLLRGAARR